MNLMEKLNKKKNILIVIICSISSLGIIMSSIMGASSYVYYQLFFGLSAFILSVITYLIPIKQKYKSSYDYLLGTAGTEIFDTDILGLDHNAEMGDKEQMISIRTEGSGRINIKYPITTKNVNRILKYSKDATFSQK